MSEPFDGLGLSLADVIDRLSRDEITKAQAAAALAPILSATSDGEIGALVEEVIGVLGRVTGIIPVEIPDDQDRPSNLIGAPGSYAWERRRKVFWGPKDKVTGWPEGDVMTEGRSALQVLVAAGILPAGSTAQDFANWLANSQSAAIQPLVDAAETAAAAAADSRASADAAATAAGEAAGAAGLSATHAGDAAGAAGAKAVEASGHADDAEAARAAAVTARNEAQQFRNEAAEIVGGDFLTEAEASGLYRKLADALGIADIAGLAAALAGKATPADVAAAINALVGAAPSTLDTIYELAAWAQGNGDALAALTLALAGKAAQADLEALVAVVGGKADKAETYTKDQVDGKVVFATVAEVRAGKVEGKIIPPKVMADALAPVVIARADAAIGLNFDLFINCNIPLDANVTLGPPSGGYPGKSGFLTLSQNATGGWLAALPSQYVLPVGGITQQTTANGKTRIPYVMGGSLEVVFWPATKWA